MRSFEVKSKGKTIGTIESDNKTFISQMMAKLQKQFKNTLKFKEVEYARFAKNT